MGNCLSFSDNGKPLPIESTFELPSPLPTWPPGIVMSPFFSNLNARSVAGSICFHLLAIFLFSNLVADLKPFPTYCSGYGRHVKLLISTMKFLRYFESAKLIFTGTGFGLGTIDLGGLQVCQITSFKKVWSTLEGGPDNRGATFFEPSSVPDGFFILGYYSQPNNQPLHGWVLAAKDQSDALKEPIDYSLVWNSESTKIKQDGIGYIWNPIAPDGYKSIGYVVTGSPEKPPLEKFRCVRADFTDKCEANTWIWGPGKTSDPNGFNVFCLRPRTRGTKAMGVPAGTFIAQNGGKDTPLSLACLRNNSSNYASFMPNLSQIEAIIQAYSPWIYFHPNEAYLPSSVSWFFSNGALLYKRGEESKPDSIDPKGSNLPQGGSNDGAYWLDLPMDGKDKERVKRGDLQSSLAYFHIKPMYGGTFTDVAVWVFYPFNGPGRLRKAFEKFIRSLPNEVLGEEGPTGPKMKNNWIGDEA